MDQEYISKQLEKFNLTNAAIAELQSAYKDLDIKSLDDFDGFDEVRSARIFMKNLRVDIDKRRKELTADALKFQRAINGEAKRITSLIKPLEDQLHSKEQWFNTEHEKIKAEEARKKEEIIQARVDALLATEARFDSVAFTWEYLKTPLLMKTVREIQDEDEFDSLIGKIRKDFEIFSLQRAHAQAQADALKKKQEEEFRKEQEILAKERKRLEEKDAALRAEEQRLSKIDPGRCEPASFHEAKQEVPPPGPELSPADFEVPPPATDAAPEYEVHPAHVIHASPGSEEFYTISLNGEKLWIGNHKGEGVLFKTEATAFAALDEWFKEYNS